MPQMTSNGFHVYNTQISLKCPSPLICPEKHHWEDWKGVSQHWNSHVFLSTFLSDTEKCCFHPANSWDRSHAGWVYGSLARKGPRPKDCFLRQGSDSPLLSQAQPILQGCHWDHSCHLMPVSGLKDTQTFSIWIILLVHNKVNIKVTVSHYPNDSEIHGTNNTTSYNWENMFLSLLVGLQL